MMGKVKGCINKECIASQEKTIYKDEYDYCIKCGNKLYYVCKKCYTKLPDDWEKYCVRCIAEKKDKKERVLKTTFGVAGIVGSAVIGLWTEVNKSDKS